MDKWPCWCAVWIYDPMIGDPKNGINPGTSFEQLPKTWVCPESGVLKDQFEKI